MPNDELRRLTPPVLSDHRELLAMALMNDARQRSPDLHDHREQLVVACINSANGPAPRPE